MKINPEPYKGLRPYQEQDEKNFFGREPEKRVLIDKILTRKLTLLFAASGVGKSSLLQAAVLPTLKRPSPPSHQGLDVVYCTDWVQDPSTTLKQKVEATLKQQNKLPDDYQLNHALSLPDFLRTCSLFSSDPLVLMLDQFEEFFNYQRYKSTFAPFITELSDAIGDRDTATAFVISMREDYALELNAFKSRMPTSLFDNYYRLESLSQERAKPVILEPLKNIGYDCQAELIEALLKDLSERQIDSQVLLEDAPLRVEPPYLQMICTQLWELDAAAFAEKIRECRLRIISISDDAQKAEPIKQFAEELKSSKNKNSVLLITLAKEAITEATITGLNASNELSTVLIVDAEHELIKVLNQDEPDQQIIIEFVLAILGYRQLRLSTYQEHDSDKGLLNRYFASRIQHFSRHDKKFSSHAFDFLVSSQGTKMAYPLPELERRIGVTKRDNLGEVLDKLEQARILRRQQRLITDQDKQLKRVPYYELYHDLFATPINDWNRTYKNRRQTLNAIFGTVAGLGVGVFLYVSYSVLIQTNSHHLRLSDKAGRSDSVEVWGGAREGLDILNQRTYQVETRFDRAGIEADKLFSYKTIAEYDELNVELIDQLPLVQRFIAYQQAGLSVKAATIAKTVLGDNREHSEVIAMELLKQRLSSATKLVSDYLVDGSDLSLKKRLVEDLAFYRSIEAFNVLLSIISNKQINDLHVEAAVSLAAYAGQSGAERAITPLIELFKDSDKYVRRSAKESLATYARQPGSERAITPLIELLKDSNKYVRRRAAESLAAYAGQPGSERAITPLIELLKDSKNYIRESAAESLAAYAGQPGSERAMTLLLERFKDSSFGVRMIAATSLAAYVRQPGAERAITPLIELLKDPDKDVRRRATELLAAYVEQPGGERAIRPLIELLKDADNDVRVSAIKSLAAYAGQPGAEGAITPLIELLKDADKDVRHRAASSLAAYVGQSGSERAITPLIELLKDADAYARRRAAFALYKYAGQPGSERAITPLIELLKDADEYVRGHGQISLAAYVGQPGAEQAITPLIELLKDADKDVRRRAAESLAAYAGQPGSERAITPLIELFKDSDDYVRAGAAKSLAAYVWQPGAERAITTLIELFKDSDGYVRARAAESLAAYAGQPGAERAITPLIELLKDSNKYVRRGAAASLAAFVGQPGSEQVIALLIRVLEDSDEYVRFRVAQTLASFVSHAYIVAAIQPLTELLKSEDKDLVFHASLTLALIKLERTASDSPKQIQQADQEATRLLEQFQLLKKKEQRLALSVLGRFPSQLIVDELLLQEQSKDLKVRTAALLALGQSLFNKDSSQILTHLKSVAKDDKQSFIIRVTAIKALGYSPSDTTVEFLITLTKDEPRLTYAIYAAIDRLNSPQSLPFLQDSFSEQQQRHQDWRDQRDQWREDFSGKEQENWTKELQGLQPNPELETWLARQIVRLDQGEAFKLLQHDLYSVRKGAWLGISQQYSATMVGKLMDTHVNEQNPLFRYALYRALDLLLQRIEITGSEKDLEELQALIPKRKSWLEKIEKENEKGFSEIVEVQKTMLERIEWTIPNLQGRIKLRQIKPS